MDAPGQRSASIDPAWPRPTAPRTSPSVFPVASCCSHTSSADTSVTLGCLVRGYFPEPVTVTWDAGSLNKNALTFPAVFDSTSGLNSTSRLYITFSQLIVSGAWAKQKFTCSVAHAGSTPINKTFLGESGGPTTARAPLSEEGSRLGSGRLTGWRGQPHTVILSPACAIDITKPTVKLFHSSCKASGDTYATIQLLCLISDYTPGNIEVTWLVDGQKTKNLFPYTSPPKLEGNLASSYSQLNITQGQWTSQSTYTCQVNYMGSTYEAHARNCPGTAPTLVPQTLRTGRGSSASHIPSHPQSPSPMA